MNDKENNEIIILSYEGVDFSSHIIHVKELRTALKGFESFVKLLDNENSVYVEALEKGSFKIKIITKKKLNDLVSIATILGGFVSVLSFVKGEPYKIDLSNTTVNGDINIINVDGESKLFSKNIVSQLKNNEFKKATQKIVSPIGVGDVLVISNEQEMAFSQIKYEDKSSICKEYSREESQFKIRGRIYEINFKQKSFKVEIPAGYSFNVSLSDNLDIKDIFQWVNTNSLELIGQIKMDMNGKITNMLLQDFNIIEPRLLVIEK